MKFETNPIVDMKGTTILVKNLNACSWKLFYELQLWQLVTRDFFPCYFVCTPFFFHEQHFFTYNKLVILSQSFPPLLKKQDNFFSHSKASHDPSLNLVSLSNVSYGNPSFQSMASSSFMNQRVLKMIWLSNRV